MAGGKGKRLVVANWKMNPATRAEAVKLFSDTRKAATKSSKVQTVVCPPFPYISSLSSEVTGHRTVLGAQDCFYERTGAYTGEVSPSQLSDFGVAYVILGHSERRALGETDELISRKVATALREGLSVIFCVGERERDSEGQYLNFVGKQLQNVLVDIPRRYFLNLIVAYEPIWAISTHAQAVESPEDMLQMGIYIRKTLATLCGKDLAIKIPILYGGSVDEKNVGAYFLQSGVDGVLVGKSSLSADSIGSIIKIANDSRIE